MLSAALAASSGRSLHLIISQLRTKYSSPNCPNHVQRTKSSIKKRIIGHRTVRSMFGEQTLRPIKNGLYVRAWTWCCFHSLIGTQIFQRALTASADSYGEIKSTNSVAWQILAEFGGKCRKAMLGVWRRCSPLACYLLTTDFTPFYAYIP